MSRSCGDDPPAARAFSKRAMACWGRWSPRAARPRTSSASSALPAFWARSASWSQAFCFWAESQSSRVQSTSANLRKAGGKGRPVRTARSRGFAGQRVAVADVGQTPEQIILGRGGGGIDGEILQAGDFQGTGARGAEQIFPPGFDFFQGIGMGGKVDDEDAGGVGDVVAAEIQITQGAEAAAVGLAGGGKEGFGYGGAIGPGR